MTNLETLLALTAPSRPEALDGLEDGVWKRVAVSQANVHA